MEIHIHNRTTHGMSRTAIYNRWGTIKRCHNKNYVEYRNYGARGIRVCDEWRKFENFYKDMGNPPFKGAQLDRYPDNNGNYCKENCRWTTPRKNLNNRRVYNKTGFIGAYFSKGKFTTHIIIEKTCYHIGRFNTAEEASEAYKKVHIEWYGE